MSTRIAAGEATPDGLESALRAEGYAIVEGVLPPAEVEAARHDMGRLLSSTPTGRNDFEGHLTRRVYALFAKTRVFDAPAIHPMVTGLLDRILGHYQLSAPVGIEIGPGESPQALHRDDAVYPLARPHPEVVVNSMWALDDFTEANGATRLVPGSHLWEPDRTPSEDQPTTTAEMPAGSVLFYLGSLWHGGGANRTGSARLGVVLEYVVAWLRPQENHCLAVPRQVAARLPEKLQELLGYNVYPPFLGYVDGRHPRRLLDSDQG